VQINIKSLAIIFLIMPILLISWKHWRSTKSPPLPPQIVAAPSSSNIIPGRYYETSMPPLEIDSYQSANFRIWVPQNVQTIRGLIVKQHGCGDGGAATGLDHANDLQWQALALKHQFALLGMKFPTGTKPCEYWTLTNYGSGAAFLRGLAALATTSQHPELERVPWVLWGHSGGADWSTQMLQQYPERTIAAIAARGGAFLLLGTNPTLTNIPVLFALGEKDNVFVNETHNLPRQVFQRYRNINAPWALAVAAQTGHEIGATRHLAIPYLDAIIKLRLPTTGTDLRPIDPAQGWLGDLSTHKIAPVPKFEGNALAAAWLPNEATALKWQAYSTTGKIAPTRKPAAPTDLKVTKVSATEALLTWHFTPDLETGLPSFHIYRNNSLIETVMVQRHNFGDAPEPPTVGLEFRDRSYTANSTYAVAAFNPIGESMNR
jgi:pimeloyl-ACP methyl ester carboxylesterase